MPLNFANIFPWVYRSVVFSTIYLLHLMHPRLIHQVLCMALFSSQPLNCPDFLKFFIFLWPFSTPFGIFFQKILFYLDKLIKHQYCKKMSPDFLNMFIYADRTLVNTSDYIFRLSTKLHFYAHIHLLNHIYLLKKKEDSNQLLSSAPFTFLLLVRLLFVIVCESITCILQDNIKHSSFMVITCIICIKKRNTKKRISILIFF